MVMPWQARAGSSDCSQGSYRPLEWSALAPTPDAADQILLESVQKPLQADDSSHAKARTNAFLLIKGDQLQIEFNANRYGRERKHLLWSITKSLTNALVGVAVREGRLSLSQSVSHYFPYAPQMDKVTIDHLLTFSSGLDWRETYEGYSQPQRSSITTLLYGRGPSSIAQSLLSYKPKVPPGTRWAYSSGDTSWLSLVLRQVYGTDYQTLPWDKLLTPLGISKATFEADAEGLFFLSSYSYLRPRDLGKLGLFYRYRGCVNGRALLPQKGQIPEAPDLDWVDWTRKPHPALEAVQNTVTPQTGQGGRHFWLNLSPSVNGKRPLYPSGPSDLLIAMGHWGQRLYIIPSWDLVVVRLADDRGDQAWDDERFLQALHRWKSSKEP
jgi:CubicO group peptidase (beta-lactamase class C family)